MSSEGILQGRGWRARQGLSRILAWPPELWPRGNLGGVWGGVTRPLTERLLRGAMGSSGTAPPYPMAPGYKPIALGPQISP